MSISSFVEYVWLDGVAPSNPKIRSKCRVMQLPKEPTLNDFGQHYFDGTLTGQLDISGPEYILKPVRIYADPFRGYRNYVALCEVCDSSGNSDETNYRARLRALLRVMGKDICPWFGFKLVYAIYSNTSSESITRSKSALGNNAYCRVGSEYALGRNIAEKHVNACIAAGVYVYGMNAEEHIGHWAVEIGYPGLFGEESDPLKIADDMCLTRYLLDRIDEQTANSPSGEQVTKTKNICKEINISTRFSTSYTRDARCSQSAIQALVNTPDSTYKFAPMTYHGNEMLEVRHQTSHHPCSDTDPYKLGIHLVGAIIGLSSVN